MTKNIKYKNVKIDSFKAEGKRLKISFYGAVFGNKDSYGDIIQKGAFLKTLQDRKDRIALCYQHDVWTPIGKITSIEEDEIGLKVEAELSAAEQDIATKIREGIVKEASIGYSTINSRDEVIDKENVTILTEIKLYEISLVTIAANPLAVITGMKAEEQTNYVKEEFDRIIAIERNYKKKYELKKLSQIVDNALTARKEPGKDSTPNSENEPQKNKLTKADYLKILKN